MEINSRGIFFTTETLFTCGKFFLRFLKISFFFSGETYLGDYFTEITPIASAPSLAIWSA